MQRCLSNFRNNDTQNSSKLDQYGNLVSLTIPDINGTVEYTSNNTLTKIEHNDNQICKINNPLPVGNVNSRNTVYQNDNPQSNIQFKTNEGRVLKKDNSLQFLLMNRNLVEDK